MDFHAEQYLEEPVIREDDSIFDAFVDLDETVRSDVFLEDSFSSATGVTISKPPTPIGISTPAKGNSPVRRNINEAGSSTSRLVCDQCRNTYANQRTLDTHKRMHAMKRASSCLSSVERIQEHAVSFAEEVVKDIMKESLSDNDSQKLSTLCQKVIELVGSSQMTDFIYHLCAHFSEIIRSRNVLLPSALRTSVYTETNKLFAKMPFRINLKDMLKRFVDCDEGILNLFIGSFVLKFFDKLLSFIFKAMRGQSVEESRSVRSADVMTSIEFQQTLYHIIGSVLHACFVRGRMYKDSPNWILYCAVLKSECIRQPEKGNHCHETVAAFSSAKDRGGCSL